MVTGISVGALIVSLFFPGTREAAIAAMLDGAASFADGAIRVSQGQEKEGLFEMGMSAIAFGGGVSEYKKATQSVGKLKTVSQTEIKLPDEADDISKVLSSANEFSHIDEVGDVAQRSEILGDIAEDGSYGRKIIENNIDEVASITPKSNAEAVISGNKSLNAISERKNVAGDLEKEVEVLAKASGESNSTVIVGGKVKEVTAGVGKTTDVFAAAGDTGKELKAVSNVTEEVGEIKTVRNVVDDVPYQTSYGKSSANFIEGSLNSNLLDELANSGVKYNPDDVITVMKNSEGKLMWLEKGNSKAGLTHILERHANDFASQGVSDIPQLLEDVLSTKPIKSGSNAKGLFADYMWNGNSYRVAYGTNGFVVSFYPID